MGLVTILRAQKTQGAAAVRGVAGTEALFWKEVRGAGAGDTQLQEALLALGPIGQARGVVP